MTVLFLRAIPLPPPPPPPTHSNTLTLCLSGEEGSQPVDRCPPPSPAIVGICNKANFRFHQPGLFTSFPVGPHPPTHTLRSQPGQFLFNKCHHHDLHKLPVLPLNSDPAFWIISLKAALMEFPLSMRPFLCPQEVHSVWVKRTCRLIVLKKKNTEVSAVRTQKTGDF